MNTETVEAQTRELILSHSTWRSLDWACRSISLAAHECEEAGLPGIVDELLALHEAVRSMRDAVTE